ncbi:MAG TPA: hypothetical protein VGH36_12745, partial [Acetobacteraceae bacterium]
MPSHYPWPAHKLSGTAAAAVGMVAVAGAAVGMAVAGAGAAEAGVAVGVVAAWPSDLLFLRFIMRRLITTRR